MECPAEIQEVRVRFPQPDQSANMCSGSGLWFQYLKPQPRLSFNTTCSLNLFGDRTEGCLNVNLCRLGKLHKADFKYVFIIQIIIAISLLLILKRSNLKNKLCR